MPKFTKLNPSEVVIGRGRTALAEREPFIEAIKAAQAGRIDLDRGDDPGRVRRLLRMAARDAGVSLRSSWEDSNQKALLWKRTANGGVRKPRRRAAPANGRRGRRRAE